jgi:hypothetical protein
MRYVALLLMAKVAAYTKNITGVVNGNYLPWAGLLPLFLYPFYFF